MGGKGGGGGVDTSGLERATDRAIDLQELIYNQTRDDVQPWYNLGTGSVGILSDLLGVSGGTVQSRQQIYDELLPQYTTQAQSGGGGSFYISPDGKVVDLTSTGAIEGWDEGLWGSLQGARSYYDQGRDDLLEGSGWSPLNPTSTQDVIDYDALNTAVEGRLTEQGVPSNYGSLLDTFDMEKFQEDPGYQFRVDEANKALERQMASQGITLGGAGFGEINPTAYRAMEELNQGLASQEYGQAYNRYVQDQLNTFNMLMGAAGMGQGSTGILATAGQNYATNVGNLQTGLASAQLNADLASQANQGSMFSSLLGLGGRLGSAYIMGG